MLGPEPPGCGATVPQTPAAAYLDGESRLLCLGHGAECCERLQRNVPMGHQEQLWFVWHGVEELWLTRQLPTGFEFS